MLPKGEINFLSKGGWVLKANCPALSPSLLPFGHTAP